jgi:hypothetical protein
MSLLSPPVSDLDLGIDIGVRMALDALTAEVARQWLLEVEHARAGSPAAGRHNYAAGVLGELAGELAGRFR